MSDVYPELFKTSGIPMSEEKQIFKKYTFYHHQFDEFTKALGALRILGLKHSFYNQAPPDPNDEAEQYYYVDSNGRSGMRSMAQDGMQRYLGDWHIIEVYHE